MFASNFWDKKTSRLLRHFLFFATECRKGFEKRRDSTKNPTAEMPWG
jgi:hypothetical protein